MVFSSLVFLFIFLPIIILVYYISPRFLRNFTLLLASLIFYAWGDPLYTFIIIFSIAFNYISALLIDKYREQKKVAHIVLIISIIINLVILSFFKYYGFVVDNINELFNLNIVVSPPPLPVGISFYTFESISYIIDVYLEKVSVQKNIISYGAYITIFPHLVAGPIIKYGDIANQLNNRKENLEMFGEGAELFITGLAKKVLLANNIALLWNNIKAIPVQEISILSAWLGIIAFTFQIYFDFSGYSDMAIGLGKMFGFNLIKNFNYPYISRSVTEFWRRWHISLGSWFREYVYIPSGGNREGRLKQYRNIFIVWFLTGLWHGASWNFIFWGLYFGIFVTIEKIFLLKWLKNRPRFIGHIYTLIVIIVGWGLFEFKNISESTTFIATMFGFGTHILVDNRTLYYLYTNAILFIVLTVCSTPLSIKIVSYIRERFNIVGSIFVPLVYLLLIFLSTAYLVNESYNPFLYFKF